MAVIVPLGPAVVDLTGIRAGDANVITMTLKIDGVPMNLVGFTVTAQARATAVSETAVLDSVVEVLDATGGEIQVRWPGDAVRTFLAGKASFKGVWDLQVQAGVEDAVTVAAGKFAAVMDVTRVP